MGINKKYLIYDFLDQCEESNDYLHKVHCVSKKFSMSFDDSEWFVRGWYNNDEDYIFYYELTKKMAELHGKKLEYYRTTIDLWKDITKELSPLMIEMVLFISQTHWIGESRTYLLQQKNEKNRILFDV